MLQRLTGSTGQPPVTPVKGVMEEPLKLWNLVEFCILFSVKWDSRELSLNLFTQKSLFSKAFSAPSLSLWWRDIVSL